MSNADFVIVTFTKQTLTFECSSTLGKKRLYHRHHPYLVSTMAAANPNPSNGFYWMGNKTHKVPMALFGQNRDRLAQALKQHQTLPENSVVLLQGGGDQGRCEGDSSDVGPVFRQESFFHWAFGVLEPDYYGAVDVATGRSILFMPKLPMEYTIFMGHILSKDEVKAAYQVDEVCYVEEMPQRLKAINAKVTLLLLNGVNSDSGKTTRTAAFDGISQFNTNDSVLHPIISELRVIKTEMELEALRYVARISSAAHVRKNPLSKPRFFFFIFSHFRCT